MISVTTTESKGINETCFVNAKDNKVTCAINDEEIKSFAATGTVKTKPTTEPAPAATRTSLGRINKLEATLRQAIKEIEELKAAEHQ
jgi:hypothetical protein